jgi:N-acetylneuraminic acid mutarotase
MKRTAAALTLVLTCLFSILTDAVATASTKENSWETLTPLPETSHEMRTAAANGKIYAMSNARNFEYDSELNKWTLKTPMPTPRHWFTIAVCQNKVYTIGGKTGSVYVDGGVDSNAVEVYDPSNDTWKILSPKPTNISLARANVVNGKIYLISGANDQFPSLSSIVVYDVARDSWTSKTTPMPYTLSSFASGVIDNKIYIIGNRTQIYDTETDSWSLGSPIPIPVVAPAMGATTGVMAPKRIYVIGGTAEGLSLFSGGTNLVQVYDPKDNTWTVGEPMPTPRLSLNIVVIADQIYALCGTQAIAFTGPLEANERYTPFGFGTPDPTYDSVAPGIRVVSPGKTYYTAGAGLNCNIGLAFLVDEPIFSVYYRLDGETPVEISGNTTLRGLTIGAHNVTVFGFDASGNMGTSETVCFTIEEPQPFPVVPVAAASSVVIILAGAGLVLYFKKRKH